jgi:hypothetical protein
MGMKNCVTCKHSDIYEYKEPCASCENRCNWESPASQWISVEDRLPPLGEVLICTVGNWVGAAWHHGEGGFETGSGLRITMVGALRVTHWMPLPEPPKGD